MSARERSDRRWTLAAGAALAALLAASSAVLTSAPAAQSAPPAGEGAATAPAQPPGGDPPVQPPGEGPSVQPPGGDPPAQPINFSHARHVARAGIDCQFCHAYARRGPVAGIPSVERCAGCHRTILSERPEIERVLDFWERELPIPWIRVHDLPDYVRFSHKAHVRAEVACAACHGDVSTMDIARQVESLSMGWCVDCHATREASRDCVVCHY